MVWCGNTYGTYVLMKFFLYTTTGEIDYSLLYQVDHMWKKNTRLPFSPVFIYYFGRLFKSTYIPICRERILMSFIYFLYSIFNNACLQTTHLIHIILESEYCMSFPFVIFSFMHSFIFMDFFRIFS